MKFLFSVLYYTIEILSFLNLLHYTTSTSLQSRNSWIPIPGFKSKKQSCDKEGITFTESSKLDLSFCDILTDKSICLFDGQKVIQPMAKSDSLVGSWNFDNSKPIDASGHRNHAKGFIIPGIGFSGLGSSASFNGNFLKIPNSSDFTSNQFTISFWFYKIEDFFSSTKGNRFCSIVQKGKDDIYSKKFKRTPSIILDRKLLNLVIKIKTTNKKFPEGEEIVSKSRITNKRWINITVTKDENMVKLYVNGVLDSELQLDEYTEENETSLYLGSVPWLNGKCDFPFLIDNMKYYNNVISGDELESEVSGLFGGLETPVLKIGCNNCLLAETIKECTKLNSPDLKLFNTYRLCTSMEMHVGGYQIVRSLGLLMDSYDTYIFTYSALKNKNDAKYRTLKGLGLCCSELER